MEEINELAFLFAVEVFTYDSVPLWVRLIQGYLLCLFAGLNEPSASDFFGLGDTSGCLPAIATTR